jgi:hypothetical protein
MSPSPGGKSGKGKMMSKIVTAVGTAAAGLVLGAVLWAPMASAAQITRFSPEGVVPQVRQVAIRFDEAMVPMGDLKAAASGGVLYRWQRWRQRAMGQRHQLGLRLRA